MNKGVVRDPTFRSMMVVNEFLTNLILSRSTLAGKLSTDDFGDTLDKECGYPTTISPDLYRKLYDREGIAARVVDVFPDESWAVYPELYETEDKRLTRFERAWNKLLEQDEVNPWHYLHRIDRLSGIGQFGVLLFGLSGERNSNFKTRAPGITEDGEIDTADRIEDTKLLYMRAFSEDLITVKELETRQNSPRFNQPTKYIIKTIAPNVGTIGKEFKELEVHWSRIYHVADNRESNEWLGKPRMMNVANRIFDIRKVAGGSGEMFWKGAFPGYSFETFPELTDTAELNQTALKEQFALWTKGLQRWIALKGMTAKSLAPQIGDPTKHLTEHLRLIATSIKVPLRVFTGSESGHLASEQDSANWRTRLGQRQQTYLNPMVIRPFVRRLMALGVLPIVDSFKVSWKDLHTISMKDQADIAMKKTQSILQYVTSGAEKVYPLIYFLTRIMGHSDDEAQAIIKEVEKKGTLHTKELWKQTAGNTPATSGTNPDKETGASGKRNAQG